MAAREDPLAQVAAQVVAGDPALRNRFRKLIDGLLENAERTLHFGRPQDILALQRAVIPQMMRSLSGADANAGEQAILEQFEQLMREMRGET